MLVESRSVKDSISRMISKLTDDAALREDLMQEALLHLWRVEREQPGHKVSWYVQSCKFHVQHVLAAGRSVDSGKRRSKRVALPDTAEEQCDLFGQSEDENQVLSEVAVREIITILSRRLGPRERAVLRHLADGLGVREIALKLRVSHPTIIKHRRDIARLALKLGIAHPWEHSAKALQPLNGGWVPSLCVDLPRVVRERRVVRGVVGRPLEPAPAHSTKKLNGHQHPFHHPARANA